MSGWFTKTVALINLNNPMKMGQAVDVLKNNNIPSFKILNVLLPKLDHPDPVVRKEVVWALRRLGDKVVLKHIAKRLEDPNGKVREAANSVLWDLADQNDIVALRRKMPYFNKPEARLDFMYLLVDKLGDPYAAVDRACHDPSPSVRKEAIFILGNDPSNVPILFQILKEDWNGEVRETTARILSKLVAETTRECVYQKLLNPGYEIPKELPPYLSEPRISVLTGMKLTPALLALFRYPELFDNTLS
jgi:HEAT repeat protein